MKIMLNVPYAEKEAAKAQGAVWDATHKTWCVDSIAKMQRAKKWAYPHNIICENLYLLTMEKACWSCGKKIPVYLLATDKSYCADEDYRENTDIQILTYVTSVPAPLKTYLQSLRYHPSFSKQVNQTYFINHCPHCQNVQGDNYLHELPEQAFYRKIFYKDSDPIGYAKIATSFDVPIQAELPYYDEVASAPEFISAHLKTRVENRASLGVTQKKINELFDCNIQMADIDVAGL